MTITSEGYEHTAELDTETGTVRVYRKGSPEPVGVGRWEDGIIRGSGINCGILVRMESELRMATGTPGLSGKPPKGPA